MMLLLHGIVLFSGWYAFQPCHVPPFPRAGTILLSVVVLGGQGASHAVLSTFHYPLG